MVAILAIAFDGGIVMLFYPTIDWLQRFINIDTENRIEDLQRDYQEKLESFAEDYQRRIEDATKSYNRHLEQVHYHRFTLMRYVHMIIKRLKSNAK